MLKINAEDFEPFSKACIDGALHISVVADELRNLKRLTPEQRSDESLVIASCSDFEDCLHIAMKAATAIQRTSSIPLAARYFLKFMKEPAASYQIAAPRALHANVAGTQMLRFSSMHELVEFAAAALLDTAPDLLMLIEEGLGGNTNIVPELLEIAEGQLVSLTHIDDESHRYGDATASEERLQCECAALHAAMRGDREGLAINGTDEVFGNVESIRRRETVRNGKLLALGFRALDVEGFYERNGKQIQISNEDQRRLFKLLLDAYPNRVELTQLNSIFHSTPEKNNTRSRLRDVLNGVGVSIENFALVEWDGN